MTRTLRQAAAFLFVATLIAHPARAQSTGHGSQAVRNRCNALIDQAAKRHYGWAWMEQGDPDPRRRAAEEVSFRPQLTPSNGLVLYLAGRRLHEPRYVEAAGHVANGIMAAQDRSGRIPAVAIFGRTARGKMQRERVPDRASTCASAALLLTLIEDPTFRSERMVRSAERAVNWLLKQQTDQGGWPVAHPPEASFDESRRLMRLSTPEYRDATFAMLLAQEVLQDRDFRLAAVDALDQLLRLRMSEPGRRGRWLWSTFYSASGQPEREVDGWPYGADMLASRYALETLLAGHRVLNHAEHRTGLAESVAAAVELRDEQGNWRRVISFDARWAQGSTRPSTAPSIFAARVPAHERTATFGLDRVIADAEPLPEDRPLSTTRPKMDPDLRLHMAAVMCGLESTPPDDAVEQPFSPAASSTPAQRIWDMLNLEG